MNIDDKKLKNIIEAALMSVAKPMSIDQISKLFIEEEQVSSSKIKELILQLQSEAEERGIELVDVASGYRYQARQEYSEWLSRLWEERPAKYSRATLETLALIAYRQPVTRAEIEDVRGVGVSSSIIKTLMEREWIRIVGHRDVPGRPALYATAKQFLDYFNMKSLEDLPTLSEIKDIEELNPELELPNPDEHDESEVKPEGKTDAQLESETESKEHLPDDDHQYSESAIESLANEHKPDENDVNSHEEPFRHEDLSESEIKPQSESDNSNN
ncbi:MAG: SMC-Scp complex subunit ScpB [Kangiellaceae bacterium]